MKFDKTGGVVDSDALANKLYQLFGLAGISQAELARRIGMQPSHLNRFLKGHGDMGSSRLLSLLSELGVDLENVLDKAIALKKTESSSHAPSLLSLESEALRNWTRRLQEESLRDRGTLLDDHLWM